MHARTTTVGNQGCATPNCDSSVYHNHRSISAHAICYTYARCTADVQVAGNVHISSNREITTARSTDITSKPKVCGPGAHEAIRILPLTTVIGNITADPSGRYCGNM